MIKFEIIKTKIENKTFKFVSYYIHESECFIGFNFPFFVFDPFLDLSLEVDKANSLQRAFQEFTKAEVLGGNQH